MNPTPKKLIVGALVVLLVVVLMKHLTLLLGLLLGLALISAPLWSRLLAGRLIDGVFDIGSWLHHKRQSQVGEGCVYYRGQRLGSFEDTQDRHWLDLADVRELVPDLPSAASLRRRFPEQVQTQDRVDWILVETLIELLKSSSDIRIVKFKNWLRRELQTPASAARRRSSTIIYPPNR